MSIFNTGDQPTVPFLKVPGRRFAQQNLGSDHERLYSEASVVNWIFDRNGPFGMPVMAGSYNGGAGDVGLSSPVSSSWPGTQDLPYQCPTVPTISVLGSQSSLQMYCGKNTSDQQGSSWGMDGISNQAVGNGIDQISDQGGLGNPTFHISNLPEGFDFPVGLVDEMQRPLANVPYIPEDGSSYHTHQPSGLPHSESYRHTGHSTFGPSGSENVYSSPSGSSQYNPQSESAGAEIGEIGEIEIMDRRKETPTLQKRKVAFADTSLQSPPPRSRGTRQGKQPAATRVRTHQWYRLPAARDGKWYCPHTTCHLRGRGIPLLCNYQKHIDQHITPYRCRDEACTDKKFSSTGCQLRHEREAHGKHNATTFHCPVPGCERGASGRPFRRQWNVKDHIKRVHPTYEAPSGAREHSADNRLEHAAPPASDSLALRQRTRHKRSSTAHDSGKRRKISEHDERIESPEARCPPSNPIYPLQGPIRGEYMGQKVTENLQLVEVHDPEREQWITDWRQHYNTLGRVFEEAAEDLLSRDTWRSLHFHTEVLCRLTAKMANFHDDADSRDYDSG